MKVASTPKKPWLRDSQANQSVISMQLTLNGIGDIFLARISRLLCRLPVLLHWTVSDIRLAACSTIKDKHLEFDPDAFYGSQRTGNGAITVNNGRPWWAARMISVIFMSRIHRRPRQSITISRVWSQVPFVGRRVLGYPPSSCRSSCLPEKSSGDDDVSRGEMKHFTLTNWLYHNEIGRYYRSLFQRSRLWLAISDDQWASKTALL